MAVTRSGQREFRATGWILLALVLLPFLVLVVSLLHEGSHFHAVSDQATEELQTRDVGRHFVTLGPYSRDNWSHPGPAMFYVLAIPYRLVGGNSVGLWIGAAILNGCAVAMMTIVAKRHGGTSLMLLTLLGSALLMRTLGAGFLRDPWNPYLPVLLFGALVFLVWSMTCGDAWALPVGAAVATFCAQTHIGFVVLALPLVAIGAASLGILAARKGVDVNTDRRRILRAFAITGGVLAVMWFPPLYDELTRSEGNLTIIVRYFRDPPPGPHYSLLHGYRFIGSQFSLAPEWIRHVPRLRPLTGEAITLYQSPWPWWLPVFAIAGIVLFSLRRRGSSRDRFAWRLAAIVGAALVLGMTSIARTVGVAYAYRLRFAMVLGMIAMVVCVWTVWRVIAPRASQRVRQVSIVVVVVAIIVVASVNVGAAGRVGPPDDTRSKIVDQLGTATLAMLPKTAGDVVVFSPDVLSGYEQGFVLWLERHGVDARVLPLQHGLFGSDRVHGFGRRLRAVLTIASDEDAKQAAKQPGAQIIALAGDHPRADLQFRVAVSASLTRKYMSSTLDDHEFATRNSALLDWVTPVTGVFLQRSPTPS
jgi:hypothetical protein